VPPAFRIPHLLKTRPFSLDEARALGLNPRALTSKRWRRLGASMYCWSGLAPEARSRQGVNLWRCDVDPGEVASARGFRTTTVPRTLLDLCARRPPLEALIALDAAVRKNLQWRPSDFTGRPGAARLRRLSELAAPAESPMETHLRWLLISAGLPRPQVQVDLYDPAGEFAGRADLFYSDARLVIEFDGGNHRERLVSDDRRQNLITRAGFRLLRFTSADVYQRPDVVVAQVRGELARARALSGPG
jgi:very-short-patch-repair endonuclease